MKTKISFRADLSQEENDTLLELKEFFGKGSKTAVVRHLIKLSREKYLK